MAEYIERGAAYNAIVQNYDTDAQLRDLDAIPAAEVVPVVRCKECAFHDTADYGGGCTKNVCRLFCAQIQNDDYCSYAIRKDGDGE